MSGSYRPDSLDHIPAPSGQTASQEDQSSRWAVRQENRQGRGSAPGLRSARMRFRQRGQVGMGPGVGKGPKRKSASTIKTDLSAIRFFHDKMSDPKYRLPTNAELGIELEQRLFAEADRAWTVPEFNRALAAAQAERRYDYILALYLARYAGLRIHECFRIDTATAEKALRENMITVKGKGGKIRSVPIPAHIRPILETLLDRTERGHKLLVPDDKPTDRAIKELQGFLRRERAMIQDPGDDRPLTFHGLRHSYASDTYMNLLGDGMSALDAHFEVSRLLGHERADVTNIYLASVRGKLDEGKEDGQ